MSKIKHIYGGLKICEFRLQELLVTQVWNSFVFTAASAGLKSFRYASQDIEAPVSELYPHLKRLRPENRSFRQSGSVNTTSESCFFATSSELAKDLSDFVEAQDFQLLTYLAIIVQQRIFIKNGIRKGQLKTMSKKSLFMGCGFTDV